MNRLIATAVTAVILVLAAPVFAAETNMNDMSKQRLADPFSYSWSGRIQIGGQMECKRVVNSMQLHRSGDEGDFSKLRACLDYP